MDRRAAELVFYCLIPDQDKADEVIDTFLNGVLHTSVATLTVGFADITAAGTTKTIDFASALPAGAVYLGATADVTAVFDNVGDSASVTFDLGIKSGDTDAFLAGASLNAVAHVYTPQGVVTGGLVGAITPSVIFTGDVNLNTLTKGSVTFRVHYFDTTIG